MFSVRCSAFKEFKEFTLAIDQREGVGIGT
jgi:hypothetical protein